MHTTPCITHASATLSHMPLPAWLPPAGLCDEVPSCLRDRITSFAGTSLIDNINDQDSGTGAGWWGSCSGMQMRRGCAQSAPLQYQ